jgi:hypothetical protein
MPTTPPGDEICAVDLRTAVILPFTALSCTAWLGPVVGRADFVDPACGVLDVPSVPAVPGDGVPVAPGKEDGVCAASAPSFECDPQPASTRPVRTASTATTGARPAFIAISLAARVRVRDEA